MSDTEQGNHVWCSPTHSCITHQSDPQTSTLLDIFIEEINAVMKPIALILRRENILDENVLIIRKPFGFSYLDVVNHKFNRLYLQSHIRTFQLQIQPYKPSQRMLSASLYPWFLKVCTYYVSDHNHHQS